MVISHITLGASRLNVSLSAYHLDASPAMIGVLGGMFGGLSIFIAVPLGRWVARHGSRWPMTIAPLAIGAGSLVGFLWHSLPGLFVTSILAGSAWGFFYVGMQHWLGDTDDSSQRLVNFTLSGTAFGASNFLSPVLAGLVIDHLGNDASFLVFSILPVITTLCLMAGMITFKNAAQRKAAQPKDSSRESAFTLVRLPEFRAVYSVAWMSQLANYGFLFLTPLLGASRGWSASTIGLVLGVYAVAMIAVRGSTAWLAKRIAPWRLIMGAVAIGMVAQVVIPLVPSMPVQLVCAAIIGMSTGLTNPMLIVMMHETAPESRIGDVVGLRVSQLYSTQAGAPLMCGALVAVFGMNNVYWILSGLLLVGIVIASGKWRNAAPV